MPGGIEEQFSATHVFSTTSSWRFLLRLELLALSLLVARVRLQLTLLVEQMQASPFPLVARASQFLLVARASLFLLVARASLFQGVAGFPHRVKCLFHRWLEFDLRSPNNSTKRSQMKPPGVDNHTAAVQPFRFHPL
jgi:hypothetical protein